MAPSIPLNLTLPALGGLWVTASVSISSRIRKISTPSSPNPTNSILLPPLRPPPLALPLCRDSKTRGYSCLIFALTLFRTGTTLIATTTGPAAGATTSKSSVAGSPSDDPNAPPAPNGAIPVLNTQNGLIGALAVLGLFLV